MADNVPEKKLGKTVTAELLARIVNTKRTGKTLAKLTHLHLEDKRLVRLPGAAECPEFQTCTKLKTLYLQDNKLESTIGLKHLPLLERLYLQNNELTNVEGLEYNMGLTTLYLEGNKIEELDCIVPPTVREVSLSRQRLPEGQPLRFSMNTLRFFQGVQVLSLSNCQLTNESIVGLRALSNLVHLDLSNNNITSVDAVADVLSGMPQLEKLSVAGNPFAAGRDMKYRDAILLASWTVSSLDGKEIGEKDRFYLARRYGGPPKKKKAPQEQGLENQIPYQQERQYPFKAMPSTLNKKNNHHAQPPQNQAAQNKFILPKQNAQPYGQPRRYG